MTTTEQALARLWEALERDVNPRVFGTDLRAVLGEIGRLKRSITEQWFDGYKGAQRAGFEAGQRSMRQRAATKARRAGGKSQSQSWNDACEVCADAITALPIETESGEKEY